MTHLTRLARLWVLASFGACALVCTLSLYPTASEAAKKPKAAAQQQQSGPQAPQTPADEKAKETAEARQAYDSGLKSYAAGKYQPAVEQLTTALKGGGLSSAEMAKALYTRGLSYKKQSKPGLAISDLTSALWLKNGLSGSDRQTATAERSEAYKTAGIADAGTGGPERVVVADPNPGSNAAGLSAAAVAEAAAGGSSSAFAPAPGSGNPQTVTRQDANSEAAQDAARARAAVAQQVPENGLESSISSSSVVTSGSPNGAPPANSGSLGWAPPAQAAPEAASAATAPSFSAVPAEAPAAPASSSMMSSVTGFFSNMFGGSSSAPQQQAPAVVTASTGPAAVAPETSSWSSNTVVTEGSAKATKTQKPVVALATPPPQAKVAKATGKYKVHIAAVRSRPEAEALAQQLIAQHGADLAGHTPTVDEAVIGSMGTFYRVRVGGYASQDEPRGLCNKLRGSGLDCLVVTN